jgi:urease accessory protein
MPVRFALAVAALVVAVPSFAHTGHASISGFLHPLSGADHIIAAMSVGLWAALLGGRSLWAVPAGFLASMAGGFAAAAVGLPLPALEQAIAALALVLAVLASARIRLPLAATTGTAGFFAVFEGRHAHGMVPDGGASGFGAGLVAATVLLLLAGVGLGCKLRGRRRSRGRT